MAQRAPKDDSPEPNLPDVVAEVRAVADAYEAALTANDVETLIASFWKSDATVRFGTRESLRGIDEIVRWRRSAPSLPLTRRLGEWMIATFGREFASVSATFTYSDSPEIGRQSQTWVRLDEGWRIVAAHVSTQTG
jgi:hypothetical protein